jgi:hemerythrin
MSNIQWDESLSVGVGLIDEQHRKWIERLNEVESAIKSRRGMQQIVSTLDFLSEYTRFHFSTEEQYMVQTGYPELENHRAKHEELKKTLGNLIEDFKEDGITENISEAVGTFLGNWLKDHIRVVDQVFAAFLKEKKIQLT